MIDVGDVEGHLFVNLAGIGLDAHVAARFNARPGGRRGVLPYLAIGVREILRYRAREYTIRVGAETWQERALVIICSNARQYGGGAVVAPAARLDDGQLDVVTVARAPAARGAARRAPSLPGHARPGARREHEADADRGDTGSEPILFHVDGEAVTGGPVRDGADPPGRASGAGALRYDDGVIQLDRPTGGRVMAVDGAGLGPRLAGKVAFITGAGMGMGREAAILFAEHGARIGVADINKAAAEETARSSSARAARRSPWRETWPSRPTSSA